MCSNVRMDSRTHLTDFYFFHFHLNKFIQKKIIIITFFFLKTCPSSSSDVNYMCPILVSVSISNLYSNLNVQQATQKIFTFKRCQSINLHRKMSQNNEQIRKEVAKNVWIIMASSICTHSKNQSFKAEEIVFWNQDWRTSYTKGWL